MIDLYLCHGHVYVWNASAACELREQHRIVGTFVGALPRLPRQNVRLGRPLQLMPEETTLLLNKGIARLLDGSIPPKTGEEDLQAITEHRKQSFREQSEMCKNDRKRKLHEMASVIAKGRAAKRKKLAQKAKPAEEGSSSVSNNDVTSSSWDQPEEEKEPSLSVEEMKELEARLDKTTGYNEQAFLVQILTEQVTEEPQEAVPWNYPTTDREALRCQVFQDLWEKGYFLTSGGKFGGDFLVYPGDPFRYHSFYIAVCQHRTENMEALDIVRLGRLGSNVKKTVLLCSECESGEITYTSLQWTGMN
ncbi:PREDICTED: tRNA-splicing endonuclease subunit Sen34-like [Branchiostoma belcheri]|uniref:tRNA-splicing endonuclease subunit Sen34 n=1 Tax=Branchiostoma belcheri TaxID=7741 RepID=A0A6P4ZF87_BRABE|nr:PREDICTED: tRNA-splicing endonuclease subunit Sen34-like [Branchiostoma belcheri]